MTCEQALLLISAHLDRELGPGDHDRLDEHVRDCPACAATAGAFRLQDAELRATFAPRREAVALVAERVLDRLAVMPAPERGRPATVTLADELRLRRLRLFLSGAMSAAAAVAGVALLLHALRPGPASEPATVRNSTPGTETAAASPPEKTLETRDTAETLGLVARARPEAPPAEVVAVGGTVRTGAGQRRRVALDDGSIVYLNQNTTATVEATRQVALAAGEVFVEVAPRDQDKADASFVVKTAGRDVAAFGTKFAVRAEEAGPGVVVTQGTVRVSGLEGVLHAGQQLLPGGQELAVAPRVSQVLDWTKDLMVAAASPLVPESAYGGGALVALDPFGQETKLSLRKYHIDVHIEDGFARTTIDQTYFNHTPARLEGTFYFPLPPDASLSRLAMYVDGRLMEGGMAERDYARTVFETIVARQKDPALLEWVDGSTFKMRVFPLEGRQEKRIILSYTQQLATLYGHTEYRFPSGHNLDAVRDWSFHALVKGGAGLAWSCDSHPLKAAKQGADLALDASANNVRIERDVVLHLHDADAGKLTAGARFAAAEQDGARYLMVRYRPELPGKASRQRRDWVFLFESSGDRDPVLARTQVDVVRTLLDNAEHDDTFVLLTAGTRVHAFRPEACPATPENVRAAVTFLERTHLVGALDLGQALATAEPFLRQGTDPYLVHVGSGIPALGEHGEDELAGRIPSRAHYVGIGVGKRWSRTFMKDAAERTDGYFTQINPDEPAAWRAFDLLATLNTPRLLGVQVVDNDEKAPFLSQTASLAQGEELCAIARLDAATPAPTSVTVSGTLDGQPFYDVLPVRKVTGHADYLPRTWARLEIERLLAQNVVGNRERIVELSKAMYVMTPYTSLLVLENEQMYAQYKVDRGRKDHWALYACPEVIPVVREPLPAVTFGHGTTFAPALQLGVSAESVLQRTLVREPPAILSWPVPQNPYGEPYWATWEHYGYWYDSYQRGVPDTTRLNLFFATTTNGAMPADEPASTWAAKDRGKPATATPGGVPMTMPAPAASVPPAPAPKTDSSKLPAPPEGGFTPPAKAAAPRPLSAESAGGGMVPSAGGTRGLPGGPGSGGSPGPGMTAPPQQPPLPTAPGVGRSFGAQQTETVRALSELERRSERLAERELLKRTEPAFGNQLGGYGGRGDFRRQAGGDEARKRLGGLDALHVRLRTEAETRGGLLALQAQEGKLRKEEFAPQPLDEGQRSYLYQRPTFTGDERLFYDLTTYAPGLQTSRSDLLALIEAEAGLTPDAAPGQVEPAARALLDGARVAGWQVCVTPAEQGQPSYTIHFDGSGRYAYDRVLPVGLREQVVCDSATLLHLYPELGVGTRRAYSRFHRAELAALVPWFLPPTEDLARGADLRLAGERTVAIVPRGADAARDDEGQPLPCTCSRLVFGADGRLAERCVMELPAERLLYRETYAADGTVRAFAGSGQALSTRKWVVAPASAPSLTPDGKQLVVLPWPCRTREVVYRTYQLAPDQDMRGYEGLSDDAALALLASAFGAQDAGTAHQLFAQRFARTQPPRLGLYTLLAALGLNVHNNADMVVLAAHPQEPLAKYLACHSAPQRRQNFTEAGDLGGPPGGFLRRLNTFHDLYRRWQSGRAPGQTEAIRAREREQALAFLRENRASLLAWALLIVMQDRVAGDTAYERDLGAVCRQFEASSALAYAARYEHARGLLNAGRTEDARREFLELHAAALKSGTLPLLDAAFVQALQQDGSDGWSRFVRETAATLIAEQRRPLAVALAWQCRALGDGALGDEVLGRACAEVPAAERLETSLAGVEYLVRAGQYARADRLLQPLLQDERLARNESLWRLAAALAAQRGDPSAQAAYLEKALDREYAHLPPVVDLQAVRQDYGTLLAQYRLLAQAAAALGVRPPDFLARVIRAADRWRALDTDATAACQAAARVLQVAGAPELAWDYLTTPLAQHPNEAAPLLSLAQHLGREGEFELADRAYARAVDAEPTNAQILWDRALNLQENGRAADALPLFRKLADETWQSRFARLQQQARSYVQGR